MKCIRKFTPVSPYDIQGLESWLQDLALQGLYLTRFRPLFSTFVQDTPRRVRYRVEFCKEADQDGPPQDLKDLYSDFGWDYMGRAWDSTLLCWDQWEVCQIGDAGRVGDGIFWKRMDIHWYRPVLPALAEPVAQGLLEQAKWPGDDKWWTIPWGTWDDWTVTEYHVDGLDWCAVAEYPGGYVHLAALSGNGRAAVVQYTGSGNLADHLEELAGMVE